MQRTREQKRAELLAMAERMVDEILEWQEKKGKATFTEIEDEVLAKRGEMSRRLVEVLVEGQEARQPVTVPYCPYCGRETEYKGQRRLGVESRVGSTQVKRGYYYCPGCRRGFSPLGPGVGVEGQALE